MQITAVVKSLCHHIKLSSCAITGGEDYGIQRRRLDKPVDVVIATPGRLVKHWKDQNIFLGSLEHVVIDEMDTMLEQEKEIRESGDNKHESMLYKKVDTEDELLYPLL